MKKDLWIQNAKLKKSGLSNQLNIPIKKDIPKSLLLKIANSKIGNKITNPTNIGKPVLKVTNLLKKRSVLAKTLKNLKEVRT
jgi:hypothetical protein